MKWYGIIAFVVLIGMLGGAVYFGANTDKLGINFGEPSNVLKNIVPLSIEKITAFDCAKTYDQMRDIYYNEWDPTAHINDGTNYPVREKMAEKEDLLLENSCMENKGDWAYKSKYENEIWGIE